jgi:hypothetical protein
MTTILNPEDDFSTPDRPGRKRLKRRLAFLAAVPLVLLILFLMLWNLFFAYVPAGKVLVIVSKTGGPLDPNEVLAKSGQKGIQKEVLAEGWHFVMPVLYTTELKDLTVIKPGKVGIVTNLGGTMPKEGQILVEDETEQGIRRHVLPPGAYRLNPYGFKVEEVNAVEIKPGYVGVLRRLLGKENNERWADREDVKGILREVLQPGLYYVNTKEYEVLEREIGIYQTSYHYETGKPSTAIHFKTKDGFTIYMDCTVEWEVLPQNWPDLVSDYPHLQAVEARVIDQHTQRIGPNRGANYGAEDFLEGALREKFQTDFTHELKEACKDQNVVVRSAFIRNIVIPEDFLKLRRNQQVAVETKLTSEARKLTAESDAEVKRAQSMIALAEANVHAETDRLVAGIDQEMKNVTSSTDTAIEKLKSDYAEKIAALDAERQKVTSGADASVTKMKETAKSNLYKLKLDVFRGDGDAYLRYTMAEQLNPKMQLRLFHSGPGTLWTNMGDKNLTLMMPAAGEGAGKSAAEAKPPTERKPATPEK